MHEMGILYRILDEVRAAAAANGVAHVRAIRLQVGGLSGLVPDFLERYYAPIAAEDPLFLGSILDIDTIPGKGLCRACGASYPASAEAWKCAVCGGDDVRLEGGREIVIRDILAETAAEKEANNG